MAFVLLGGSSRGTTTGVFFFFFFRFFLSFGCGVFSDLSLIFLESGRLSESASSDSALLREFVGARTTRFELGVVWRVDMRVGGRLRRDHCQSQERLDDVSETTMLFGCTSTGGRYPDRVTKQQQRVSSPISSS